MAPIMIEIILIIATTAAAGMACVYGFVVIADWWDKQNSRRK